MLHRYNRLIQNLYSKQVPATGLAIFRIVYGIILLLEVVQLYYFRQLIFDKIPYIEPGEVDFSIVLFAWILVLSCLILGLFTKYVVIINYVLTLVTFSVFTGFEYHLDRSIVGINFLLLFAPASRVLSLDRLILKLKSIDQTAFPDPQKTVSVLVPYGLVGLCIGLVYFDSIFWKLASPMWLKGLGFWLPTSVPYMTYLNHSYVLNIKWLSLLLGYISLIFETVFLFLFWFKRFRLSMILIGVGLHLGILLCYPIPLFALGITSLYILLIPDKFWRFIKGKLQISKPALQVFYDNGNVDYRRLRLVINYFDIFEKIQFIPKGNNEAGIYCLINSGERRSEKDCISVVYKKLWYFWPFVKLFYFIGSQFSSRTELSKSASSFSNQTEKGLSESPVIKKLKIRVIAAFILYCLFCQAINIFYSRAIKMVASKLNLIEYHTSISKIFTPFSNFNKYILGISTHPVFNEGGFINYQYITAIIYKKDTGEEVWLPIIDENGQAGWYNTGRVNKNWTYRVNGPTAKKNSNKSHQETLEAGIKNYTSFWAHKNDLTLQDITFTIRVKKITPPQLEWKKDHLNLQLQKPWLDAGTVSWKGGRFIPQLKTVYDL